MREGLMGVLGLGGGYVEGQQTGGSTSSGGTTTLTPPVSIIALQAQHSPQPSPEPNTQTDRRSSARSPFLLARLQAKLVVLKTLSSFLNLTLNPASNSSSPNASNTSSQTAFFAPSFATSSAFANFASTLSKGKMSTLPGLTSSAVPLGEWAVSGGGGAWDLGDFSGGTPGSLSLDGILPSSSTDGTVDVVMNGGGDGGNAEQAGKQPSVDAAKLYLQLHPLLLSTFLDAAPTSFSPSASGHVDTNMELVVVVGDLIGVLGRTVLQSAEGVVCFFFLFKSATELDILSYPRCICTSSSDDNPFFFLADYVPSPKISSDFSKHLCAHSSPTCPSTSPSQLLPPLLS